MSGKKDPYASEAKTKTLLVPDIRTEAERKLVKMMGERGADEQGAEAYLILRQIAVDLLAEKPAQRKQPTLWSDAQHERAYRNSPELHKDVKSLAAFKRVAKAIAAMYDIKGQP